MDSHYDTEQQITRLQDKDWLKTLQLNEEYKQVNPLFVKMMQKYESMWDSKLGRISAAKHGIVLFATGAPPIHLAPYRASPKQREHKRKEKKRKRESGIAESTVTEQASLVVFVPK